MSVQHAAPSFGPTPCHLSLDGRDPTCVHAARVNRGSYHNFPHHQQQQRSSGSFRVLKLRNLNMNSSSCTNNNKNDNAAMYKKLAQDEENLSCAFALDRENDGLRETIEQLEMIAIEKQALVKRVHYLEAVLDEWQDEREFNSMCHHGHSHVTKGGGMMTSTSTTGECSNSKNSSYYSAGAAAAAGAAGASNMNAMMTPSATSDLFNEEDFHSFSNLMTLL